MVDDRDARIAQLEAEFRQLHDSYSDCCSELAAVRVELESSTAARAEALEQEAATAEILRVIASSPADAQPVLDAVVESAMRLSGSTTSVVALRDGDRLPVVAKLGLLVPEHAGAVATLDQRRSSVRALLERRTIHISDYSDPSVIAEYPDMQTQAPIAAVAVPLVREQEAIGILVVIRDVAEPYSDREIALVETFADQTVIAIENARLFEELERRNAELTETLEQQTATADILRVIASSPTDAQPVIEAIVQSASQLSDSPGVLLALRESEGLRVVARVGVSRQSDVGEVVSLTRGWGRSDRSSNVGRFTSQIEQRPT